MSNVLKFPRNKPLALVARADQELPEVTRPRWTGVWTVAGWVLLVLRVPAFLLMYWLRLPILFVCNLVSLPMLLLWLFSLYAFPDKHVMVWGFGVISFVAFAFGWIYDWVLMAIAPQDMVRTL
jgi:hypothetical protein